MVWTQDRAKLLRKLWADGLSASQCAARLGGITRNAVIGKVHRMGLPARATIYRRNGRTEKRHLNLPLRPARLAHARPETKAKPAWTPKDIKPAAPQPPQPPIPSVHLSTITGCIITGPDPIEPEPLPPPEAITSGTITTLEITARNCCWPVNDGAPEWLFCGKPRHPRSGTRDRGYCQTHWARSVSSGMGRLKPIRLPAEA